MLGTAFNPSCASSVHQNHPVNNCPAWVDLPPCATFLGSAATGLGFYHIEVPSEAETQWLNFNNCGVVNIKQGVINLQGLEQKLSAIFCRVKQWPWQIREVDDKTFVFRFPPWKNVAELIDLPAFALEEGGVTVKITEWEGAIDAFGELIEAWIQIDGITPRWCSWKVFAQLSSCFGLLIDNWSGLFKSFCQKVRIKVACKDPTKVPSERVVEMRRKLFLLRFSVEGFVQDGSEEGDYDGADYDLDGLGDDFIDAPAKSTPTAPGASASTGKVPMNECQQTLLSSVVHLDLNNLPLGSPNGPLVTDG